MKTRRVGPDQARRPFGRPPRDSVEFHVRLPATVADEVETDAREAGYPSAVAYIRAQMTTRTRPPVLKHRVYAELVRQLTKLGNNLNQLTRAVHAGRAPYIPLEVLTEETPRLLRTLHEFLLDPYR